MADVAARAGVSAMTVSRVIRGEAGVRPETRDAINAAIASLGYAPNSAARHIQGAARSRVGLLSGAMETGFRGEILRGVLEHAIRRDVQIIFEEAASPGHELEAARRLVASGVHGVLLPSLPGESRDVLNLFRTADVPSISIGVGKAPEGWESIGIDDFEGARAMTQHILALGHRRIAFIRGDPRLSASARRYDGYAAALKGGGIRLDTSLVADGVSTYRSGLDAAEQLLALEPRPTAIFASSDDMAAAAVAVAHRLDINVPGALTVCGFDDTALATAIWPALTTIRQPIAQMARDALEILVNGSHLPASRGAAPKLRHDLSFVLVCRQSDAVPQRRPAVLTSS